MLKQISKVIYLPTEDRKYPPENSKLLSKAFKNPMEEKMQMAEANFQPTEDFLNPTEDIS